MWYWARWTLVLCSLLAAPACAGSGKSGAPDSPRPAHRRSDLITIDEISKVQWPDAYQLVDNLRPQWLRPRGPDTLNGQPVEVQAIVDGMKVGGVSSLRGLPASGIAFVQYYDGITASARWGLGFQNGAIYISTRTR